MNKHIYIAVVSVVLMTAVTACGKDISDNMEDAPQPVSEQEFIIYEELDAETETSSEPETHIEPYEEEVDYVQYGITENDTGGIEESPILQDDEESVSIAYRNSGIEVGDQSGLNAWTDNLIRYSTDKSTIIKNCLALDDGREVYIVSYPADKENILYFLHTLQDVGKPYYVETQTFVNTQAMSIDNAISQSIEMLNKELNPPVEEKEN